MLLITLLSVTISLLELVTPFGSGYNNGFKDDLDLDGWDPSVPLNYTDNIQVHQEKDSSNQLVLLDQAESWKKQKKRKQKKGGDKSKVKIAFIGDQGLGDQSRKVLKLIRKWDADLIVHAGDFDYVDNPTAFQKQLQDVMGTRFPYLSCIGNHDLYEWEWYKDVLQNQLVLSGFDRHCKGIYGVKMVCLYQNIFMVFSGVATRGGKHPQFIDDVFKANRDVPWKICVFHKNQHKYQTGTKQDEVGYEVYEVCRRHGAIIATAHEHSYSRTKVMSDFVNASVVDQHHHHHPLTVVGEDSAPNEAADVSTVTIRRGETFAFVSGLGGRSIRQCRKNIDKEHWWASYGCQQQNINHGALLCEFWTSSHQRTLKGAKIQRHESQDEGLVGKCQFKTIDGIVYDQFVINNDITKLPGNDYQSEDDFVSTLSVQSGESSIRRRDDILFKKSEFDEWRIHEQKIINFQLDAIDLVHKTSKHQHPPSDETQLMLRFKFNMKDNVYRGSRLQSVNLQFYGHGCSCKRMHLHIRAVLPNEDASVSTSEFVIWTIDDDSCEKHEVWNSPDLLNLLNERKPFDEIVLDVAVISSSGSDYSVFGFDPLRLDLAPSLFFQYYR
ncbi:hypothetical protein MIR68_011959 [Amoeboaphelidium protococcarum]|nr:hypothetical protein MIR68_011959 [Amoeboaphelidium protococcarum]